MTTQEQPLNIGVIGTGVEGSAIIRKLTKLGHCVCISNASRPETLTSLAEQTGAKPKEIMDVVQHADIIFLSIPMKEIPRLPKGLFDNCRKNCIIVDTCNYYPSRDGKIQELEDGMPESIWVMKQVGKPVIKAFNNILAPALVETGRPKLAPDRIALPVSGDDLEAKNVILKLVNDMGFDAYDAGDLSLSWRQQPGSPVYCTNLDLTHLVRALNFPNKKIMPQLRDEAYRKMVASQGKMDWKAMVAMLRETYGDPDKQMSKNELKGGLHDSLREVVQEPQ